MSEDGYPQFRYEVFDDFSDPTSPFEQRIATVKERVRALPKTLRLRVVFVPHIIINSPDEVLEYERACLAAGYEGVMIRSLLGPYKFGRSTPK
jgi:ATP-dependent DNA ligase